MFLPVSPDLLRLPPAGGARGPEGLLRRAPLARRAALLPLRRLLRGPGGPALHGGAGGAVLLRGLQEEDGGLRRTRRHWGRDYRWGWDHHWGRD